MKNLWLILAALLVFMATDARQQDKPSWRPGRYNFIENVPRLPENLPGLTVSDSIMQKLFPDKFSAELSVGDTPVYSKSGFESGHQHQEESWKDDPGSRSPLHS